MADQFIDCMCADGRYGLRVRFSYLGDRFGHTVELLTAAGTTPVLVSRDSENVEADGAQAETPWNDAETRSTGTDEWPPSPPLQQLSLERNSRGERVALLLGMAGRSHWSLSVEPDAASSPSAGFTFDVACRPAGVPGWLGSGYQSPGLFRWLAPSRLAVVFQATELLLEGLAVADFAAPQVQLPPGGVLVVPQRQEIPTPTVRWKYRVSWSGGARP